MTDLEFVSKINNTCQTLRDFVVEYLASIHRHLLTKTFVEERRDVFGPEVHHLSNQPEFTCRFSTQYIPKCCNHNVLNQVNEHEVCRAKSDS